MTEAKVIQGNGLREKREVAGLSLSKVERITSIPRSTLARYERGECDVPVLRMRKINKALKVVQA